jgi:hypothetical protein
VLAAARKAGADFAPAWPMAVAAAADDDRPILIETSAAWRLEYERRDSYGGNPLATMAAVLDDDRITA